MFDLTIEEAGVSLADWKQLALRDVIGLPWCLNQVCIPRTIFMTVSSWRSNEGSRRLQSKLHGSSNGWYKRPKEAETY